jgi:syntaxin 8
LVFYFYAEQDSQLDMLSHSINRQRDMSLQINDELEVHTGLLEELDTDLGQTDTMLGSARRRLDRVAKGAKNNGAPSFYILFLHDKYENPDSRCCRLDRNNRRAHPHTPRPHHHLQNMTRPVLDDCMHFILVPDCILPHISSLRIYQVACTH